MCHTCGSGNCKGCGHKGGWCGCTPSMIAKVLVVVGALNWGLVGAGMLAGSSWNLVNMLVGSWPTVEAVVYVLVGLSALMSIWGCKCKKCMTGSCGSCGAGDKCLCGGNCTNGKCDKCGGVCGEVKKDGAETKM